VGKDERKGARRDRNQKAFKRTPELGYYFVVTDTQATEANYLRGFIDLIPQSLRGKLVLKVIKTSTSELLKKCLEMVAVEPQYRKPWIVFDRDQVKNFDQIIEEAERQGVNTGWSNPCLEIWFHAYFGDMPVNSASMQCVNVFEAEFKRHSGQKYDKADEGIYRKLLKFGNEEKAIKLAKEKHQQNKTQNSPSEMLATTTLYVLIDEIKRKIKANQKI